MLDDVEVFANFLVSGERVNGQRHLCADDGQR